MKLLVTGGNGMVGSTIDADVRFASQECDLTNFNDTLAFFKKHSPEAVIHCAGKIGGVGINSRLKGEFFYKNTMINTNVLEVSRLVGVKKLVCLLSTCIFPVEANYPLTSDQIHSGEPHPTSLGYSYSKRLAEIQIRTYREQYGVNYVSIVPCNIYGPRDNFKIDEGHVVPSLIHKCYLAKKNNTPLKVWGTGKPQRELLYSQDAGDISTWAINNYDGPEPLITSTSMEYSIKELVETIVDVMDFKGDIIWETDKTDGQFRKPSDNTKFTELNPDFKYTPLKEGVEKTVEWFIKNYDYARK